MMDFSFMGADLEWWSTCTDKVCSDVGIQKLMCAVNPKNLKVGKFL